VLTTLPPSTTVVLLDEAPARVFLEAVAGAARLREFGILRPDELRRWAAGRIRDQGGTFAPSALDRLLTLVDANHLGELAQEIDKLVTYASCSIRSGT
jgi:DNA polymerase III delta subunit